MNLLFIGLLVLQMYPENAFRFQTSSYVSKNRHIQESIRQDHKLLRRTRPKFKAWTKLCSVESDSMEKGSSDDKKGTKKSENKPKVSKSKIPKEVVERNELIALIDRSEKLWGNRSKPRLTMIMIVKTNYSTPEDEEWITKMKFNIENRYGPNRIEYHEYIHTEDDLEKEKEAKKEELEKLIAANKVRAGPEKQEPITLSDPEDVLFTKSEYGYPIPDDFSPMSSEDEEIFEPPPLPEGTFFRDKKEVSPELLRLMNGAQPIQTKENLPTIKPDYFDHKLLEIYIQSLGYVRRLFSRRLGDSFQWSETIMQYAMDSVDDFMDDRFHLGFDWNRSQKTIDRLRLYANNSGFDNKEGFAFGEFEHEDDDDMIGPP